MIPNAVASTGPYAGLWSHLKSIDHALERAMAPHAKIGELDRDRLHALIEFLNTGLDDGPSEGPPIISLLAYVEQSEPNYGAAIDLRKRLGVVPEFQDWKKASKKGVESKISGLIKALEDYLAQPKSANLFTRVPQEEFCILRAILKNLLADAEAALR